MASSDDLLSRKELIALWTEMAKSFGSTLELPVDNNVSLVMKFCFANEYGETEIMIKDLAGSGQSSWSSDPSQMSTEITTKFNTSLKNEFKIVLPPLFSRFLKGFIPGAGIVKTNEQEYWIRCKSVYLLKKLITSEHIQSIHRFRNFFALGTREQIVTRTTSFLDKEALIKEFANFHLGLLKLVV